VRIRRQAETVNDRLIGLKKAQFAGQIVGGPATILSIFVDALALQCTPTATGQSGQTKECTAGTGGQKINEFTSEINAPRRHFFYEH
jgi:hypothetical protein